VRAADLPDEITRRILGGNADALVPAEVRS